MAMSRPLSVDGSGEDAASAFAFRVSYSDWEIAPESSSSLAFSIWCAGVLPPAAERTSESN